MPRKRAESDRPQDDEQRLNEKIAGLSSRPRTEVVEEWVRVYGGLRPETRRYLLEVAEAHAKGSSETPARKGSFKPGMRLVRQWHGKTYTVDVLDKGFAWNGKLYKSLSPIAKAITGAVWSGPRFFRP